MTPAEALATIKRATMTHQLKFLAHAYRRMEERGATVEDIEHACQSASRAVLQENERWCLDGRDREGDALTVIAMIEAGVVVVTLY